MMEWDLPFCPTCGSSTGGIHADAGDPASAFFVPVRLTPKESAVFEMIRRGLTNDEIARQMFVSRNTVKFHVKQVYRKLGIRCRRRGVIHIAESALTPRPRGTPSITLHPSSTCSA